MVGVEAIEWQKRWPLCHFNDCLPGIKSCVHLQRLAAHAPVSCSERGFEMRFRTVKRVAAVLFAIQFASAAPAAELIVDGDGELTGATGVDVGGTLYDVEFLDGTCTSVFNGCDSNSDFAFGSLSETNLAGQALMDQVFLGIYDSQPHLTRGCEGHVDCAIWIPFNTTGVFVDASGPTNGSSSDGLFIGNTDRLVDFSAASAIVDSTWARFTVPVGAPVPELSTWTMMLLGFGAVGFWMRRRGSLKIAT